MARGGRPRKRFTSRPPSSRGRGRKKTQASPLPQPKPIIAPKPKLKQPSVLRARTGGLKGRPRKKKPTGLRSRPRPTRVTVASPSGKEGRFITVSSRSILARPPTPPLKPRKFAKIVTKARGKKQIKFVTKRPKRIPPRSSFGSDFDIFRVSDVGGQVQLTKQTTRTGRTGKKKPTGIPQSTTDTRVSRPRKPQKAQPRFPPSENPFVQGLFEVAGEVPLFIPRQVGKAVTQVTERISKKPLPKEERLIGDDFDVLNFFG